MTIYAFNRLNSVILKKIKSGSRSIFYWVTVAFNRVDPNRIKEIGPDLACAEWLLRNGAFVRWKGLSEQLKDYNALPGSGNYSIEAVEANNAGICDVGFPHFEGCNHIKEIKLESCKYINNNAMRHLSLLKDTLTNLELVKCKSIDDNGLRKLKELKHLKTLKIKGLPAVAGNDVVYEELADALPECKIEIE